MSRKRLLVWSVVLVACVLTLAACGASTKGSSPATSTTTTSPSGGATASSAFAKYATCLQQHGVTPPAGGGPPQGGGGGGLQNLSSAERAKFQAARTACASLRPAGAGGFQRGGGNSTAFAAYANCLKLHGVTVTPGKRPNTTSNKVQTAMAACASLRPSAPTPPASN
jgi:hypothetical protein